jgi:hypothetical protein
MVTMLLLAASGGQAVVSPHVYWTSHGSGRVPPGTIGRANLDGTGVDQNFISDPTTPLGLAVDSSHVYWANVFAGTIARANLDGTGVDQNFITGAVAPLAVAVDSGHVYWADQGTCATTCPPPQPGDGLIGRANLDGTGVDLSFITGITPTDVAVDANHVYWGDTNLGAIGRANLDGSGVNQSFIGGRLNPPRDRVVPLSVAVDAVHVYWGNGCSPCHGGRPSSAIGRATLDGTGVNLRFIRSVTSPSGVAVDANHVYWSDRQDGTIGRANLDGTGANQSFITGATNPDGVAVDAG